MGKPIEPPRLSAQGLKVLRAFLEHRHDKGVRATLAGADIMRAAGISSGTMYPLLLRLEESGILESSWETQRPEDLGRPRRRLYRLTPNGADYARKALEAIAINFGLVPEKA